MISDNDVRNLLHALAVPPLSAWADDVYAGVAACVASAASDGVPVGRLRLIQAADGRLWVAEDDFAPRTDHADAGRAAAPARVQRIDRPARAGGRG